jgi:hypothetical protein
MNAEIIVRLVCEKFLWSIKLNTLKIGIPEKNSHQTSPENFNRIDSILEIKPSS